MNCTNKQQETAECEKRGCEGCFYNEKTADEMFEELGYIVEEGRINVFIGRGKKDEDFSNDFIIHKKSKSITIYKMLVSMQELQAINKKVQELGWKG